MLDYLRRDNKPTRADDERLLRMLEARDRRQSASQIAARFATTRSAVLGALRRIDLDLAASELPAVEP